ncbi:inositol monophosphatase family protein [Chloroflexota bacterium]
MDPKIISLLDRLADTSAEIILRYYRTDINVDDKSDGSPVTIADRSAEAAMREIIMDVFPEHGIIGEEYGIHQGDAEYVWTLDPIDGTKNFVAGSFLFTTLVGLLKDGKPVLGMINHPLTGHRVIGDGRRAWMSGEDVRVRACDSLEDALLLGSTHVSIGHYQNMDAYNKLLERIKIYRTWGDGHGYFLLATGYADIVTDPIMALWDVAPLIPIVEGAGGRMTDWHGGPIFPSVEEVYQNGTSCIATAGSLHDEIVQLVYSGVSNNQDTID